MGGGFGGAVASNAPWSHSVELRVALHSPMRRRAEAAPHSELRLALAAVQQLYPISQSPPPLPPRTPNPTCPTPLHPPTPGKEGLINSVSCSSHSFLTGWMFFFHVSMKYRCRCVPVTSALFPHPNSGRSAPHGNGGGGIRRVHWKLCVAPD